MPSIVKSSRIRRGVMLYLRDGKNMLCCRIKNLDVYFLYATKTKDAAQYSGSWAAVGQMKNFLRRHQNLTGI